MRSVTCGTVACAHTLEHPTHAYLPANPYPSSSCDPSSSFAAGWVRIRWYAHLVPLHAPTPVLLAQSLHSIARSLTSTQAPSSKQTSTFSCAHRGYAQVPWGLWPAGRAGGPSASRCKRSSGKHAPLVTLHAVVHVRGGPRGLIVHLDDHACSRLGADVGVPCYGTSSQARSVFKTRLRGKSAPPSSRAVIRAGTENARGQVSCLTMRAGHLFWAHERNPPRSV